MEISLIDIENSCRTCLLQFNRIDLDSIFEDTFEELEIYNILKLVAPISINECDGKYLNLLVYLQVISNLLFAFRFIIQDM